MSGAILTATALIGCIWAVIVPLGIRARRAERLTKLAQAMADLAAKAVPAAESIGRLADKLRKHSATVRASLPPCRLCESKGRQMSLFMTASGTLVCPVCDRNLPHRPATRKAKP